MRFDGKVVVITGVGREGQVGETLASTFCEAGARVIAVDLAREEVAARAAALTDAGFDCQAVACNLASAEGADVLRAEVERAHGGADALIHAAGGFAASGPVAESDPAIWERMMTVNLTTAYHVTRALLPLLRRRRGAIVYFGSTAALEGARAAEMSGYVAAKAGLLAMMRAVSQEEAEQGVRANAIAPVAVRTAANVAAMGTNARYVEREEIAAVARFLCSDDAVRVTGQVVVMG